MKNTFATQKVGLFALLVGGCSSDSANATGGSPDGSAAGGVTVSGVVREFAPATAPDAGTPTAIAGVKACAFKHSEVSCATTGADGSYSLFGFPTGVESGVTFEKQGYLPVLAPGKFSADATVGVLMPTDTIVQAFSQIVGSTYPFGDTGVIIASGVPAPSDAASAPTYQAGISLSISPKSGSGPFYANNSGIPDTTLNATTAQGFGAGFANVAPGEVEVTFSHPTVDCSELFYGWASTKPGTLRAPVVAGFLTNVNMRCK